MVMSTYLAKRIVVAVFSIFVVASLVFFMTTALPGSAADIILGNEKTPEAVAELEKNLGLDRPMHERYIDFVVGTFTLNWGNSYISNTPIIDILGPAFFRSMQLGFVAMVISTATGVPLGLIAAAKRDTWIDSAIITSGYLGVSLPSFVSATLLLLLLASPPFDIFPNGGYAPISEGLFEWFKHLLLPALALNVVAFGYIMRQTRGSMIETLESDYIRTARLKGLPEWQVLSRHALRNGLLPAVTVIAINFGWMMGGLVIVETIFSYPGIGRALVKAIQSRDVPVLQVAVLVPTAAYVFANLGADIVYTILDPRISLEDS